MTNSSKYDPPKVSPTIPYGRAIKDPYILDDLRKAAKHQRWAMGCLCAFVISNSLFVLPYCFPFPTITILLIALFSGNVTLVSIVAFIYFARGFMSNAVIAAICFFLLVPVLGPIVFLFAFTIVNERAVKLFRDHGIPFGFFGVNPKSI